MIFVDKIERAKKLIKDSIDKYPNCCVAISFGKDSLVLLHLIREVKKDIPMFSVFSNTEFKETIDFKDEVVRDWELDCREYEFENNGNPDDCCRTPKVEKFKQALKDYDMWFSGIRCDEGITRSDFKDVEEKGGLTKVNPILLFTERDIWRYIALYKVPFNPLYKEGYRSLSCKLCSEKEQDENELEREGRWKGTCNKGGECGIHTKQLR